MYSFFLFFKQKTAYEMRISDWSSDVCSSDLLSQHGSIRQDVARSFIEIEQARLLTLKAADAMDKYGNKKAADLIAAIKIFAPHMAHTVADRAIQIHDGMDIGKAHLCTPVPTAPLVSRLLHANTNDLIQ